MICRKKEYQIGDLVTMTHCWGGYRLPPALPDGSVVEVLERQAGQATVVYQGRKFVVSAANIESGWEYRYKGAWRDETDPLITMEVPSKKAKHSKKWRFFAPANDRQVVTAKQFDPLKVNFDLVAATDEA